jgi:hypothetical protein
LQSPQHTGGRLVAGNLHTRGCFWTVVLTLTTWVMAIGLAVFLFG